MQYEVTQTGNTIEIGATGIQEIIQNVKIILSTQKGTVPLDRDFGLDLSFLDAPTPVAKALAVSEIIEEVEKQEPRVLVKSVEWIQSQTDEMDGKMVPKVLIQIKEDVSV
ncbi:MAG: GPW/gp25 family protein [Desulfobacteraceae bacterium]|nr:GPW/gp25 family protein [Desulfobacteraceae bacterium]